MKAVVLVSGGLDSATTLAIAVHEGYDCHALSFRYGQRHDAELEAARTVCSRQGTREHRILTIDLGSFGGSAPEDVLGGRVGKINVSIQSISSV